MKQNDALHGLVPDTIRLADVEVLNLSQNRKEKYLMLLNNFNVEFMWINEKPKEMTVETNYTFLLVMPRETIIDKIDKINSEVLSEITLDFIWPFTLFVIFMMIIISYILKRISVYITEPIIDLFKQIQDIITEN